MMETNAVMKVEVCLQMMAIEINISIRRARVFMIIETHFDRQCQDIELGSDMLEGK